MFKNTTLIVLMMVAVLLAACNTGPTGDTSTDREAAQSLMPAPAGYSSVQTDNVQDALATALGGATVASGNLPAAAAIERLDNLLDCYRDVGAVDARIFVSNVDASNLIPQVGAVGIVNESRVVDNFLNCAIGGGNEAFGAPAGVEPCVGSGRITVAGDSIAYVYGASDPNLCSTFATHFAGLDEN